MLYIILIVELLYNNIFEKFVVNCPKVILSNQLYHNNKNQYY